MDFDKQLCYCTVCAKSSKSISLEENIISVQHLSLCLLLFFVFSSEVLNSGIKSCFDRVVFQDAVCEECFIYVFGVFTFSVFCYCFYEGFIPKIILVSWFLLFICISYLLKVFRFDTGILRDSFAVLLRKTLSQLPQCVAFYAWFPFRTFITMICWTSTEVLLNLVSPLDSAVLSLDFEEINIFWTFGFDSVSILFDPLIVSRRIPKLNFSYSIYVFLLLLWMNQYMVYSFDSTSIAQFPTTIFSISAEGSLNLVAH